MGIQVAVVVAFTPGVGALLLPHHISPRPHRRRCQHLTLRRRRWQRLVSWHRK